MPPGYSGGNSIALTSPREYIGLPGMVSLEQKVLRLNSEVHNIYMQLGVVIHLPPIEAFENNRPSKEDLDPESVRVGDISVPADLSGLGTRKMSIWGGS